MDRQAHEYAAAMAFAQQQQQQQQQFGFHPQQQFPPSVHGPPFLPPQHQQYPFPRHMQPHQLHPHPPPPPHHLMHLQPQQHPPMPGFPPHVPPHLVPSGFQAPYDSAPPPSDPDLQKRIDKLVEYAVKVGPEFEIMIREKEQDNPAYSFLFGGEGHNYYRYKLWLSTQPTTGPSMSMMHPSSHMMNAPPLHQPPFPPFYDQQQLHHQHPQPFLGHVRPDFDPGLRPFKGLAGPLPSDVAVELNNVLGSLTGTKESIKSAKAWFLQRSPFAPALAEALRDRIFAVDDSERQLHIVFLANDILFDSLTSRRSNPHDLDNEALAFKPVIGSMLARIYHNPQNKEENQSRLQKILQFWASKEVYDQETIRALENEMIGGPIINSILGMPKELPSASLNISAAGSRSQWHDRPQGLVPTIADKEHLDQQISPLPMMLTPPIPPNIIATPGSLQSPLNHPPTVPSEKLPPYPLFPPGLIPGMVRKMQIGSGVPYSPMSPLDIPTVIPPSDVPQSEILERVSKFFKEIGEVNPSDGPMKSNENDDDDDNNDSYGRRGGDTTPVRKGGACIPPPANLLRGAVDPETGTYADGSVERKPGSSSSGRLGLGATADPNEVSQYDDVYSSYRKQRSSNYHTSMSARATTTSTSSTK